MTGREQVRALVVTRLVAGGIDVGDAATVLGGRQRPSNALMRDWYSKVSTDHRQGTVTDRSLIRETPGPAADARPNASPGTSLGGADWTGRRAVVRTRHDPAVRGPG